MRAPLLILAASASMTAGIFSGVSNAADDLEAMAAAATSKWKAQREGVVPGQFSVRLYRYGNSVYKEKISAKKFRTLIDGIDSSKVEAVLGKLQNMLGESSTNKL